MANLYDLKKFDLNLLIIFESIYQHQSISKAAETLFITPSAVSQSLQRLRAQLNDPLFVRSGKGVTPTTVGINLHSHLEENLNQLEQTINIMNRADLKKNFIVYSPKVLISNGLTTLINTLQDKAAYTVEHHNMLIAPDTAEDLLNYRKADLIISLFPVHNHSIICRPLKSEPLVLVCRKQHPRLDEATTTDKVLEEGFTFYNSPNSATKELQAAIEARLPQRNTVFRSDSMLSILSMISQTDLVGVVSQSSYLFMKDILQLKQINIGTPLPNIDYYMLYNRAALRGSVFSQFIDSFDSSH